MNTEFTVQGDSKEETVREQDRQQICAYQAELDRSREQITVLLQKVAYYEKETARLQRQIEILHETAWELIHRVRKLESGR